MTAKPRTAREALIRCLDIEAERGLPQNNDVLLPDRLIRDLEYLGYCIVQRERLGWPSPTAGDKDATS